MFNSEAEKQEKIKAAQEAGKWVEQLRGNPVFKQAFIEEKARLFNEFCYSKWYQWRLRHSLWQRIQAVNALESKLISVDHAARMAEEEVKRMAKEQDSLSGKNKNRFTRQ